MALQPLTESEIVESLAALDTHKKTGIKSVRVDIVVGKQSKVVSWQSDAETAEWVTK